MPTIKELRDKVLSTVRFRGPVLPIHVAKDISMSSIIAGAVLSDLVALKLIKVSTAKIGGSPVYYAPGQEERLSMLYAGLGQKEREAYTLLKEHKILKDRELVPAIRVALQGLKDFARPREITTSSGQEMIWQWHLHPDEDIKPIAPKEIVVAPAVSSSSSTLPAAEPPVVIMPSRPEAKKENMLSLDGPSFTDAVHSYLKTNTISVLEQEVIRKNRESHLVVKIPSPVGLLDFLLIAKSKKKISDADLSLCFQKGQGKKLPVLLLSNGDLTKKAKDYHDKHLKGYVLIRTLP